MSALRVNEVIQEVLDVCVGYGGGDQSRCTVLQRGAKFLRDVRYRQAAPALRGKLLLPATNLLRRQLPQILHRPIRGVLFQFGQGCTSRRDREDIGSDGATAFHIKRRVANDDNFFAAQSSPVQTRPACVCRVRNLIAILVIVGKCAKFKLLPQIEVAQFDFRAEPDVAGQQTERWRLWQRLQIPDQFPDAGTRGGFALGQDVVEPENVTLEETLKMRRIWFDVVQPEKLPHQAHIRAPGELHFLRAVKDAELSRECFGKRLDARAAGVNEGAINVEKDEFDHLTQGFDGGFEARDIRNIQHLRFFIDAFHEAGQGRARAEFDEARVTLSEQITHGFFPAY